MKKGLLFGFFICFSFVSIFPQQLQKRPLTQLLDPAKKGWTIVQESLKSAKNSVEFLPKDSLRADTALYRT